MPTVGAGALAESARSVLAAAGAPGPVAAAVADSLVLANLKGVDSHGVVRVAQYVSEIERGLTRPDAEPEVALERGVIRVDGRQGFGQVAARQAVRLAVERTGGHGLALATVRGVRHVGRLGEYVELAARAGCLALAFCNAGPPGGRVAPHGGRGRALGTNPLAYAVPTASGRPIAADFATSAMAEGSIRLARQRRARLPGRWIVGPDGELSDDPEALYAGGAILPACGHRGYALALLAELLGGVVAGAGCASLGADPGNGLALLALPLGVSAAAEAERVAEALRAVPPAAGAERVLVPGDLELETEAARRRDGVPVADGTWQELAAVADRYGIALT